MILLRTATAEDLGLIRSARGALALALTGGLYSLDELGDSQTPWTPDPSSAALKNGHLFVAVESECTQKVLGFCEFDLGTGRIGSVCVLPQHEGRGIGRELVRECLKHGRAAGCKDVQVDTVVDAVEFFQQLGFDQSGSSAVILPNGEALELITMGRPVEHPLLQDYMAALTESVEYFGSGAEKQRTRDRQVVLSFLRGLGVEFADHEIIQIQDPPDV